MTVNSEPRRIMDEQNVYRICTNKIIKLINRKNLSSDIVY